MTALVTGTLVGVGTLSRREIIRQGATGFIWIIRGTPLLVQLFMSYFALATAVNYLLGFEAIGALAMSPDVLLLDEITSALDVEMVAGINELLTGLASTGMTMVVVTHDIGFARQVAHRICFFDSGRIIESGAPEALIEQARSPRLIEFLSDVLDTP